MKTPTIAALAVLAACGGKPATTPTQPEPPPAATAESTPPPQPESRRSRASARNYSGAHDPRLVAMMPKNSLMYFAVDGASIRANPLWAQAQTRMKKKFEADAEYKAFVDACNLDPLARINSLAFAAQRGGQAGTFIVGGISRGELRNCVHQVAGTGKHNLEWMDDGAVSILREGEDTVYLGWVAEDIVVFGSDDSLDRAWIDERLDGRNGLIENRDLLHYLDRTSPGSVWGAIVPDAQLGQAFSMLGGAPKGIYLSVDLVAGLTASLGLVHPDTTAASQAADSIRNMLQMASGSGGSSSSPMTSLFDNTTVDVVGNDAVVRMRLTEVQLGALAGAVGAMVP